MSEGRTDRCGWVSDLPRFYETSPRSICMSLEEFVANAGQSQHRAWGDMVAVLHREFGGILDAAPHAREYSAVLEYELPREGGRRPDVVVLENGVVAVLEFKGRDLVQRADLDQTAAYACDLKNYHAMCRDAEVEAILVPTRWNGARHRVDDVVVCPSKDIGNLLVELSQRRPGEPPIDAARWLEAEYAPLPGIVQAARDLFHHRPLPNIRRAQSARLPEVHALLSSIAHEAASKRTRHLVLLTGVPGSGKTLAGLQFVHSEALEDLRVERPGSKAGAPAVFLSGNGPLVVVLQHALGNVKTFVQGMRAYLEYYAFKKPNLAPPEHVLVFDEAQRAWDADQVEEKHGTRATEPQLLLDIADRIPEWSVVLGLVGEGQEIHRGEEGGLGQWSDAIAHDPERNSWIVHGPERLRSLFSELVNPFVANDLLNLSTTLRSHLASDLHDWVRRLLELGDAGLAGAAEVADRLRSEGYVLYVTRDLDQAKAYVRDRYEGHPDRRYGLVASSRAKNLEPHGVDNLFQTTKRLKVGPWFNDPATSAASCCALGQVVTEFACQGLELDFPIVCWGDDLNWDGERFASRPPKRTELKDPHRLRVNAYRVLLTRGRDGMCVYIPPDEGNGMDSTAAVLLRAGFEELLNPAS